MIFGIDACNIRGGGGLTHLIEFMNHLDTNDTKVYIWSNKKTLNQLPDSQNFFKRTHYLLNSNFVLSFLFQKFFLKSYLLKNKCELVFVPGGTFLSSFQPFVTISQNLLPFEQIEIKRFNSLFQRMKFNMLRKTQIKTFKKASGLIFLTNYAKKTINSFGKLTENQTIIPHGIDITKSCPPKEQKGIDGYNNLNPFRLLYVSNLLPYKHQWNIAAAVCSLRQKGFPLKLTLIGPPTTEGLKKLKQVQKKYPIYSECINYYGSIDHSLLFQHYLNHDAFIFGSTCENLPIILLEAMSSGLPILSSKYGPMPEVLGLSDEQYFDPLDVRDIEVKLSEFLINSKYRKEVAKKGFSKACSFTWEAMTKNTLIFFQNTLNNK